MIDAGPLPSLTAPSELERDADCVVIGAGIIGLATALRLRQQRRRVLLLESTAVAAQASGGNAGACAYSDILPLACPGIVRQAPRWLLDPLGPLAIPPRYLPRIAPWLWRFWRASRPRQVRASTQAQAALMDLARQAMPGLVRDALVPELLRNDGNLHLYTSRAEWHASLPGWAVRAAHGIAFEHLMEAQAIEAWQPGVSAPSPAPPGCRAGSASTTRCVCAKRWRARWCWPAARCARGR